MAIDKTVLILGKELGCVAVTPYMLIELLKRVGKQLKMSILFTVVIAPHSSAKNRTPGKAMGKAKFGVFGEGSMALEIDTFVPTGFYRC